MARLEKFNRVQAQLKSLGVTSYGRMKDESQYLADVIHDNETIHGVAYGRADDGSAMLIATDKRIIFFDKKPLFQTVDELTYDVVSGVKLSQQPLFSTLTLHTRVGDYVLRYVNLKSSKTFKKYLENYLLEHPNKKFRNSALDNQQPGKVILDEKAQVFLYKNTACVLSTIDRTGNVGASVVYYTPSNDSSIYILTKTNTQKARNIFANSRVAVTIFNQATLETLQLQGIATIETDLTIRKQVFSNIVKNHDRATSNQLPVFQIKGDEFIVIKIEITSVKFSDYKN